LCLNLGVWHERMADIYSQVSIAFVFDFTNLRIKNTEVIKMGFNYGLEKRKYDAEWAKKRIEYVKAGMEQAAIDEMYEFDMEEFRNNRIFALHNQAVLPECFSDEDESDKSSIINKFCKPTDIFDDYISTSRYGWIEDIDDTALYKKLKQMSEEDLELLTLLIFDDFNQSELSRLKGLNQSVYSRKLKRIKNYLKNF
jgi:DNA-directed RNA polymerase specialized sigma subunit